MNTPPPYTPPRKALAFLHWFCAPDLLDEIEGDLFELFHHQVRQHSMRRARWLFWWNVLWFFRPYVLRRSSSLDYEPARGPIMWKNVLVVTYRSLLKHKFYTLINVLGLAVGLAVCLLIFLYVQDERSYDQWFTGADRIYRVGGIFEAQQVHSEEAMIAYPAAELLKQNFPEVEETARLISLGQSPLFVRDENRFYEERFFLADSTFFAVFDLPFIYGDPETALRDPGNLVLTASTARKYFGETNPVGQTLSFDNRVELTVTGVIRDLPPNTHLAIDLLVSQASLPMLYGEGLVQALGSWGWPSTYTYARLTEGHNIEQLRAQLPEVEERHDVQEALDLFLQPVTDIHLHSQLELEMQPNGSINEVYAFSVIALLVLLIACINFVNLSTARSTLRLKEVGLRKVVGAQRSQLIGQFLAQSVLVTLIGLALALLLVQFALPVFNGFLGKELAVGYRQNLWVPLSLLGLVVLVGIGAGSYPAFYLSRGGPVQVLRGHTTTGRGTGRVRKVLVVTQFAISIVLIVVTGVVFAQMRYASTLNLGYEREQVVILDGLNRLDQAETYQTLRNRLLQHTNVESVTSASLVPTQPLFAGSGFNVPGRTEEEPLFYRVNPVDYEFFETFGIDIVAGRGFSREYGSDLRRRPTEEEPHVTTSIILNESAVAKAGWASAEGTIGQTLRQGGEEGSITYTVVGVARDIYFSSLHYEIEPLVYFVSEQGLNQLALRIGTGDLPATLAFIDETWSELVPTYPVTRSFLDTRFEALYEREARAATGFTSFALLAILIACLGLLGLAAFTAEQRRKEIGVRKVLGASVRDIMLMLSWDFTKLVVLANLVAWPVAYFLSRAWLSDFAYRVNINISLFILAGGVAFLIAWGVVAWQTSRAALSNPVHALRET